MDTNRLKPTIPDSSEGEFAKLEVAWERIFPQEPTTEMKGDSFLYAILDVFLNELRTLILAPNNLDYVSDPGNVIKDWDNTTYFSVINAIGRGLREKDWQSFVNLEIVRPTDVSNLPMTSGETTSAVTQVAAIEAAAKSWKSTFKGEGHKQLWEHIRVHSDGPRKYANMCAIVQSSGTGKSRVIDELGKSQFVIPMNLIGSTKGYPLPDEQVRSFLVSDDGGPYATQGRHVSFLRELFKHTLDVISQVEGTPSKAMLIEWFYNAMSPSGGNEFRKAFFDKVVDSARKNSVPLKKPNAECNSHKRDAEKEPDAIDDLRQSARELCQFLLSATAERTERSRIQVVLAFDEAQTLYEVGLRKTWSPFVVFRDALWCTCGFGVWSLFLSTTGKLSQLNSHRGQVPSMRIQNDAGFRLAPPFTILEYDMFAPRITYTSDGRLVLEDKYSPVSPSSPKKARMDEKCHFGPTLTLDDVTNTGFLVKFGRPLFVFSHPSCLRFSLRWTDYMCHVSDRFVTRYENGPEIVRSEILGFALSKLTCIDSGTVDHLDPPAVLACLSQRLCLDLNSSTYNVDEDEQVAAHMRLCVKIGPDNQFIMSTSGSEPILAEAASYVMRRSTFRPAESLKRLLSGVSIHKGDRSEVVALLAVTSARDAAFSKTLQSLGIKEYSKPWDEPGSSRIVGVVDFMKHLFKLDEKTIEAISMDFGNSFTYFNHFSKPINQATCHARFLLQYMTRGAALLCGNNIPGIDFAIPILHGKEFQMSQVNAIVVQVKNDRTIKQKNDGARLFTSMSVSLEGMFREMAETHNPKAVIQIIFSFGSSDGVRYESRVISINRRDVRAHQFWCGGVCPDFLPGRTETDSTWATLASASMGLSDVFSGDENKESRLARQWLLPGGSDLDQFWRWMVPVESIQLDDKLE